MRKGYFKAAWGDIKQSDGWLGKVFLLGLISLIPIFGQVVLLGYAFGWMRDIAWNAKTPLPARIFGNEDGQLYRRGLIVLAIDIVFCAVAPGVVEGCWNALAGRGLDTVSGAVFGGPGHLFSGQVSSVFGLLISLIAAVFYLVAATRASIYGRLGPGFQLGRLWAMMRHDPKGLARVVLMGVAMTLCVMVVAGIVVAAVVAGAALVGVFGALSSGGVAGAMAAMLFMMLAVILCIVGAVVVSAASAFISLMVARAMGYWVQQFDVPAWRGQDDPMPFEMASGGMPR